MRDFFTSPNPIAYSRRRSIWRIFGAGLGCNVIAIDGHNHDALFANCRYIAS
ncbi:MAG: hypothetical protein LBN32_04315 [Helicobacteraceae bacterium]|nr:hypothetical protein [Helicobacteraceae bacterium]